MLTSYATPTNVRRALLDAVVAAGHHVTVIAPESAEVMRPSLSAAGIGYAEWAVNRTGIDPIEDLHSARQLFRILRDVRPDVLLVNQIKAVLIGGPVARLARVPHVVILINGLGMIFDEHGFGRTKKARLARRAYGLALRQADELVFQNPDDPRHLQAQRVLGANARWTVVPGSGVDLVHFTPSAPPTTPLTFTFVSRMLVSKGVRELVAATERLREEHPSVRVRLVGQLEATNHPDAITRPEIDRWVAAGLVEYVGFTSDIRAVLANTSVFVLPSYYREGVPRTNLEALAMGRPIITTDWVGCRETVVDGVNGFLVPPRDAAALAERMARYARDPDLLVRHGREGRALAERRFDVRRVNELMLRALRLGPVDARSA